MDKKKYISPETEEILLEPAQMIAESIQIGEGEADGSDALVNERDEIEGGWGNLW